MSLTLIAGPAVEPVTLLEMREHLKIDGLEEDATLEPMIAAARRALEDMTWRSFVTTTWEWRDDAFPDVIRLPRPPLQAVTSIVYVATDGTETTLAASSYQVDNDEEPARVVPAYGESWPSTRRELGALRVRYTAGYPESDESPEADALRANVPEDIKLGVKWLVALWHGSREPVSFGRAAQTLPFGVESIMHRYRAWGSRP